MMECKVVESVKNPFLSREELVLEVVCDASPSIQSLKDELKRGDDVVVVRRVQAHFGQRRFLADVVVYDSVDARDKVETIPKKLRKKLEEERKAAEEQVKKEAAEKKAAEEAAKVEEAKAEQAPSEEKAVDASEVKEEAGEVKEDAS